MIKLSEAIELGIGICKHTTMWDGCVLGTALLATGFDKRREMQHVADWHNELRSRWPWLTEAILYEIQCKNGWKTIRLSRQLIADWIKTIEPTESIQEIKEEEPCLNLDLWQPA